MSLTRLLAALPEPLFSNYELSKVLGVGAYAIVYQVQHKKTKKAFALKVIEKEPLAMRLMLPQLQQEVALLTELSKGTPHVVQLLEATETTTHVFLRFELCSTNLEHVCEQQGEMPEEEALRWMRQACLGVKQMHAKAIIHRDLKPSNFLVDAEGTLSICDFGFACKATDKPTGITGTPTYAPPEQKACGKHTKKVDIYSLGASLQHLLLGRCPLGPEDMPKGLSESTCELLEEMMSPDPKDRPTISEVLKSHQLQEQTLFTQWLSGWQVVMQGFSGH